MEDVPSADVKTEQSKPAASAAASAEDQGDEGEEEEDAPEEESKAEKKQATPRKPREKKEAKPAAAPVSAGTSSRGRERKSVQAYAPESPKHFSSDEILTVEEGPGTQLAEIENVKHRMDITHATEPEMKAMFHACFPHAKTGHTKKVVKANIRAFSGYPTAEADELAEAASARLEKNSTEILKLVAQMCDLSQSGTRAKLIEHIVDFLRRPKSSGGAFQGSTSSKKRKSAGSKKKKSSPDKPKRPLTPYFVFLVSGQCCV
jgi:hypothetical protein